LTVGGSAGVVWCGRSLVVTWICRIAVSFHWLVLPRRSRETGVLRIGEIASLVLYSDVLPGSTGKPGRRIATGEMTGDFADAAGRLARESWLLVAKHCSTGLRSTPGSGWRGGLTCWQPLLVSA
jgi:hypothetical protein